MDANKKENRVGYTVSVIEPQVNVQNIDASQLQAHGISSNMAASVGPINMSALSNSNGNNPKKTKYKNTTMDQNNITHHTEISQQQAR